jgi:exopolysaccharide biosynthesis polyprenyl glycosylphosphotransferase
MFQEFIRKHGWPKVSLLLLDWAGVSVAAFLTFVLHYLAGFDEYDIEHSLNEYIMRVGILYLSFPVLILIMRQHLLYKQKVYTSGVSQLAQLARSLLLNSLLLIAVLFFLREDWIQHSRTNLMLFTVMSFIVMGTLRVLVYRKLVLVRLSGRETRRILLVGAGEEARVLINDSERATTRPFEVVAVVDQNNVLEAGTIRPVLLSSIPLLSEYVSLHNIHEVVVAENELPYEDVVRIISEARDAGVAVHLLSDHFRVVHERVTKSASEFLNVTAAPVSHGHHGFYGVYLKRLVDLLGGFIAIAILSPVWIAFAVLIKMSSRGPLLFKTTVIGHDGHPFEWYKFRTMRIGIEDDIHRDHVVEHIRLGSRPTGKLELDPRITGVGRWLRKHSLDELPQLLNVMRGQMSLVGPRPCLPYEFEQYLNWHKERFVVRPGMTGLWQVSGRSTVSFNDMVILDLYYIHNLSLWLDAAIVLRTIAVVVTGKGGG